MPALYVISFARTKKINSPINLIGAFTSDLIYYFEVWKEECAGSIQRHAERTYGQRDFSRTGMNDLLPSTSIQQASEVTGHSNMLPVYWELYHSKNHHQANFPPLSFSCFLAFWPKCCGTEHSHPGNAHRAVGGTLAPRLPLPTQDRPRHLLPALSAPPHSSHLQLPRHGGPRNLPFWLVAAAHRAWSFMPPLTEQYLCSSFVWYKSVLILLKKRTSVSFPFHPRRHMVGISKSGNHVKPFEVLGSVQKAISSLKTQNDLNPWQYFNLSTLISITTTICEMNKPKLFLFW